MRKKILPSATIFSLFLVLFRQFLCCKMILKSLSYCFASWNTMPCMPMRVAASTFSALSSVKTHSDGCRW